MGKNKNSEKGAGKGGRGVCILLAALCAAVLVFTVALNALALTVLDGLATAYFGTISSGKIGGGDDATEYYASSFSDAKELAAYEEKLGSEIAQEGVVLLKNEKDALPFERGTEVSLFGTTSVNLVCGGSGSGAGSVELNTDLKTACEAAGLKVNEKLWDFYSTGNGAKDDEGNAYGIGPGSIRFGAAFDWSINEVPAARIQAEPGLEDTFAGTKAVYLISRTGGEDGDNTRDMAAYGGKKGQHYLELDDTEKGMVDYLTGKFDSVTVIVNANNAMELGWVNEYANIDAVIDAPGLGRTGAYGLANVMVGYDGDEEISPSGHLVDTLVYDDFSSPAMQNMGDFHYTGTNYNYISCSEGIYVGYRYYETRYEDAVMGTPGVGDYDYDRTVVYPFGYGLSYTNFAWSDFAVSEPDENGDMTVTVTVANTGKRSGRDVVQLYFQSPYTDYDVQNQVEKASVELCGYAKTENLKPGERETVEITVNLEELRTYDAKGYQTYILEGGTYYLTAAADAHSAVNNILLAKGYETAGDAAMVGTYVQDETDAAAYAVDSATGVAITNRFDDASMEGVTYLTRSNWKMMDGDGLRVGTQGSDANPMEQNGLKYEMTADDALIARLDAYDAGNPSEYDDKELPVLDQQNDLELIDLRGLAYDDPLWEELLAELSLDEMRRIVYVNGYSSLGAISSVKKPVSAENDGPAGINDFQNHASIATGKDTVTMTWPTETLLACTYHDELAAEMGRCIGEDGLYSGVVGWYGPAMNLHRTPFAGRNFEYYSEDPYLSGRMAHAESNSAAAMGMICYIKHFAVNDQETNRSGVATWACEQAIRELYLQPFEMALKNNTITVKYLKDGVSAETQMPGISGMMSSFNRIGATWAGGSYQLLTGVARGEWGFDGIILTDYNQAQEFMDTDQMLKAGGDTKLRTLDNGYSVSALKRNPVSANLAREAAHRYLYAQVNSAVMNHMSHGTHVSAGFPIYKVLLIVWDVLAAVLMVLMVRAIIKRKRRPVVTVETQGRTAERRQ